MRRRFVFIANSKSASTSIEALLANSAEIVRGGPAKRKHVAWSAAREEYAFLFDQPGHAPETFFRFGVVREPADWFRSWYAYRSGDERLPNALPPGTSLEEFWQRSDWVKWRKSGEKHLQKHMFTDADGECRFVLVIPYEELDRALPVVLEHLGLPPKALPRRNASGGLGRDEMPAALAEEINEFYREDVAFHEQAKRALPQALARLRERRPKARAEAAAEMPALNYESVLIVTYGRSGSTLLQGLLNSIDGCVVRGENHNFCYPLFQAYDAMMRTRREHPGERAGETTNPWFGANVLSEARFIEDARRLVRAQLVAPGEEVRCFGFKEIRYERVTRLPEFLDFLARVFPKPAFIVLTRDHAQVMKSGWWAKRDPGVVKGMLADFERQLDAYGRGKPWVFPINYRDMVERSERLRALFEFLGAPYDAARVEQVLATPHSYAPASAPKHELSLERFDCPGLEHLVLDSVPGTVPADERITLRGVAVLQGGSAAGYRLAVRDAEGEKPVEWGMPSPKFAQRYPGNAQAANARFRASGLALGTGGALSFLLVSAEGQQHEIARVLAAAEAPAPTVGA